MTKYCPRCGQNKQASAFYKVKKKCGKPLSDYCKPCVKTINQTDYQKYHQKRMNTLRAHCLEVKQRNRKLLTAYLAIHFCVDCGEPDPIVLEFDHRDPSTKRYAVARMLTDRTSWKRILEEIQKCDVRCSNCHQRKTFKERGWSRGLTSYKRPL